MNHVVIPWPPLLDPYPILQISQKTTKNDKNPSSSKTTTFQFENTKYPSIIPCKCLDIDSPYQNLNKKPTQTTNTQSKTFDQALSNICYIPTFQHPQPVFKGDNLAIAIPEEEYMAGIAACKHNLHARIIWPKGATPLTVFALRTKLSTMWKGLNN